MSDTTIELSHVSKRYRLRRGWYVTSLRDEVGRLGARLLGRRVEPRAHFWALKDVNISLNGSIMGMSRREIQNKFDQIVAFAEIEQFVDTPVKHYSSGMQMRLGFAAAAHTDPDILLIDEIDRKST